MVFFSCEGCGQSVKKPQVEKHKSQCRSCTALSCLDCSVIFHGNDYQAHTKCITEEAKYSGKNFVPKEAKGEMKQQSWFEQVQSAIRSTNPSNHQLKRLLQQLENYPNIPRKEAKFKNFVANSLRVFDKNLVADAWAAISKAAQPVRKEESEKEKVDPAANGVVTEKKETLNAVEEVAVKRKAEVTNGVEKKRRKEVENDAGDDDSGEKNGDGNVTDVVSFNWKSAIKQNLKSQPDGGLKLKKLRKLVVKQFLASLTDTESLPTLTEATAIFQEKLEKLQKCKRLTIEDKTVKLETRSE